MSERKKVLFVCTGNTCRSPMAEGFFRKLVAENMEFEVLGSAGVAAFPGDAMSPETGDLLKKHSADEGMGDFLSRAVDDDLLSEADDHTRKISTGNAVTSESNKGTDGT